MSGKTIASLSVSAASTEDGVLDVRPSAECAGTSPLLSRTLVQTPATATPVRSSRCDVPELAIFAVGRLAII